jgi:hypothetical protein
MSNWFLEKSMNYLIGKDVFGKIKNLVFEVATDEVLTGIQKREKVINELKTMGVDFTSNMITVGIEAAVIMLKQKTTK